MFFFSLFSCLGVTGFVPNGPPSEGPSECLQLAVFPVSAPRDKRAKLNDVDRL